MKELNIISQYKSIASDTTVFCRNFQQWYIKENSCSLSSETLRVLRRLRVNVCFYQIKNSLSTLGQFHK